MSLRPEHTLLYWETARHLRPVQIYHRLWFHAVRPAPDLRLAPPLRLQAASWISPARRRQSQIGRDRFRFLNEEHSLSQHGWDDPAVAKLWRYNLHYFDDLNAEGAGRRRDWHRDLIVRWIAENPPAVGTGWEPYPTSLRIVNWIKWALGGDILPPDAIHSLAVQARWLVRRLEYHLLGNHLFANAKAMVFAGCFFSGREAEDWLELGLDILGREVPEQILSDGGHFELSPMYHALALEDMLDLANVLRCAGASLPHSWVEKITSMRTWLTAMCHPDGAIAYFNDAALGIAPSTAELEDYAGRLGLGPLPNSGQPFQWLKESGYIRLEDRRAVALLDVARVGPDYIPGHAHADTLSFELSVLGQRILVNSGTSVYGTCAERLRQRGTAAHNTVVVDDEDSSEVWSGFRVARRARPEGLAAEAQGRDWIVTCGHDGYRRLPNSPRHRRTWRFGAGQLTVSDRIEESHGHAVAAFHLHPSVAISIATDGTSGIVTGQNTVLRWHAVKGTPRIEPSTWHPEFGTSVPSSKLMLTLANGESVIEFSWRDG